MVNKQYLWSFPAFSFKLRVVSSRDSVNIGWQKLGRKASHNRGRTLSNKSLWRLVELVRVRILNGRGRKAQNGRKALYHHQSHSHSHSHSHSLLPKLVLLSFAPPNTYLHTQPLGQLWLGVRIQYGYFDDSLELVSHSNVLWSKLLAMPTPWRVSFKQYNALMLDHLRDEPQYVKRR